MRTSLRFVQLISYSKRNLLSNCRDFSAFARSVPTLDRLSTIFLNSPITSCYSPISTSSHSFLFCFPPHFSPSSLFSTSAPYSYLFSYFISSLHFPHISSSSLNAFPPDQSSYQLSLAHSGSVQKLYRIGNRAESTTQTSITHYYSKIERFQSKMANLWNELPTPNVIFVLGGPGSGKGTQCSLIAQEFGYVHLSAGDLLRKEQNTPGSELGELIAGHIRNGSIVPVEITCSLIENAMLEHMIALRDEALINKTAGGDEPKTNDDNSRIIIPKGNFLIDGFPRNQNNLEGWKRQVADKIILKFVLFFECPKDVCVQRCLERGKNSGREDDNPESMIKRLDTYLNQTMPIIEFYDKLGLVRRLDAEKSIERVFEDVKKLFI